MLKRRASREPIVAENPDDPMNRRIGIVLLRDTSKDAMMAEHEKKSRRKEYVRTGTSYS